MTGSAPTRRIDRLAQVIDAYRVLFVDAYGTLHDGRVTLPFVAEALTRARAAGRIVVIVTNSPQRVSGMVRRMASVGFPEAGYDHIASSGELTWRDLETRNGADAFTSVHFILQGSGVPWLGEVRNLLVRRCAEADLIIAAGMPHATEEEARASPLARDLAAARAAACRCSSLTPTASIPRTAAPARARLDRAALRRSRRQRHRVRQALRPDLRRGARPRRTAPIPARC